MSLLRIRAGNSLCVRRISKWFTRPQEMPLISVRAPSWTYTDINTHIHKDEARAIRGRSDPGINVRRAWPILSIRHILLDLSITFVLYYFCCFPSLRTNTPWGIARLLLDHIPPIQIFFINCSHFIIFTLLDNEHSHLTTQNFSFNYNYL